MDDGAHAACWTEFADHLGEVAEVISARIEGWGERNTLNVDVNGIIIW